MQEKKLDILERTYKFGVRIIKLTNSLPRTPAGYAIANQLVRSGTSVGANLEEAQGAHSKKDFIHGMTISLKEASESLYWLRMLEDSGLVEKEKLLEIVDESEQIVKILITSLKKAKINF